MSNGREPGDWHDEANDDRLRGTIAPDAVSVGLVSAFAGDRPLTEAEGARIRELQGGRGAAFFSDLIYAVSHHYFAPDIAEDIWNAVLSHKYALSEKLERNVRITVATLDYLSNITGEMRSLTLMSEACVTEIVNLSMRDGMTGLFNHSTCYELMGLEVRNHQRYGMGLGLILLDIDDFKSVNDRWGHQEGDRILVELARTIEAETRESDICCRIGGEEFAVILPFTEFPAEALGIAERIRVAAERLESHGRRVTVSAGVALCAGSGQSVRALVGNADRALYRAKREGKNRTVMAQGEPRSPLLDAQRDCDE
jgi:diguanylate cyclase (GGDEF)-like protein